MSDTTLNWDQRAGQYCADNGDRTYIVRTFDVGAYDGDPLLTMYDERYRSECWSLRIWGGQHDNWPGATVRQPRGCPTRRAGRIRQRGVNDTVLTAPTAGTAGADPTPAPSPPYVIQTPAGPTAGGLRTLPPICAVQPRACNLNWSPDTGSWVLPSGTD